VTTGVEGDRAAGTEEDADGREDDHAGSSCSVARVHLGAHAPRNFPRSAVVFLVKGLRSAPMIPTSSGRLFSVLYLAMKMPTYKELLLYSASSKGEFC
jgi:hypothetical protein